MKIFAYILLKLTRTSLDLVESHSDYTAAHSAKDPVLLWDIVLDTHESSLYNSHTHATNAPPSSPGRS